MIKVWQLELDWLNYGLKYERIYDYIVFEFYAFYRLFERYGYIACLQEYKMKMEMNQKILWLLTGLYCMSVY